ncbi:Copper radical oxidase [Rhizoctonia solani]|uniref:Copper radical oxidase n=1 Tax=Rhizoctonia solani TaxID=456999 RepID=A0A8H7LHE4_9AGAM|nr:Copper radical oxidase [Rhizoctonia solani]
MFDSIASAALVALLAVPARAQWTLTLGGTTGVSAMQMTVATETNVVVIDKYEQNPLRDASGDHSLGSIYSTDSNTVRPLNIKTNSFCATGTWLSNGTLVNAGGNPRVDIGGGSSANGLQGTFTSLLVTGGCKRAVAICLFFVLGSSFRNWQLRSSIIADLFALLPFSIICICHGVAPFRFIRVVNNHRRIRIPPGLRQFNPCNDGNCDIYESPSRIRLTSSRWYPSSCRLSDGSAIIVGGAYGGGWTNFDALNNPTYEFYPPKNINGFNGLQIPMKFLLDTLPHNMFPHVILLPDNQLFMAANSKAMKFNWETNTETRLPDLPNKQITVYPMSAPAVLLPLTWENNYKPEVVIFGGSQLADTVKENEVSSQSPTSKQASRIALDAAGIANGWSYDEMPEGRVMADATILPDGKVLIMNGAKTGTAGYGNVPDQIGQSNADNPAFTPVLYDPAAPAGSRFSSAGMPTSNIARLYHSVSTLLPDGRVMIAGSNPNADVETRPYKTEYQVEYISPPYMTKTRPTYTGLPAAWNYGQNITLSVTLPASLNPPSITVSLMDLGFSTHGVHMDMRMIKLKATLSSNRKSLVITGPPNASIYPPGPAWVYVLSNGVPSKAQKVLIGTGASPPVNQGAIDNMLALTGGP